MKLKQRIDLLRLKVVIKVGCRKIMHNCFTIFRIVNKSVEQIGIPKNDKEYEHLKYVISKYDENVETLEKTIINNSRKYVKFYEEAYHKGEEKMKKKIRDTSIGEKFKIKDGSICMRVNHDGAIEYPIPGLCLALNINMNKAIFLDIYEEVEMVVEQKNDKEKQEVDDYVN